jgi:hypothetical protein
VELPRLNQKQRHHESAQELEEEFGCKLGLQFKHIVVKSTICIPMDLDIKEEAALLTWKIMFGLVDDLWEVDSGSLKVLLSKNNVVQGNPISTGLPFNKPRAFIQRHDHLTSPD